MLQYYWNFRNYFLEVFIMANLIVFVMAVIVGLISPTSVAGFLLIADMFLPDPFPFADEVGLVIGIMAKMGV